MLLPGQSGSDEADGVADLLPLAAMQIMIMNPDTLAGGLEGIVVPGMGPGGVCTRLFKT